ELDKFIEGDRSELRAYRKALAEHAAGYEHLASAKKHNDLVVDVNPRYKPALDLQAELFNETRKFEVELQNAEMLLASKRYDDAFAALGSYRSFEAESPRVQAIVAAAYSYHFNRGQELGGQQEWEKAAAEF